MKARLKTIVRGAQAHKEQALALIDAFMCIPGEDQEFPIVPNGEGDEPIDLDGYKQDHGRCKGFDVDVIDLCAIGKPTRTLFRTVKCKRSSTGFRFHSGSLVRAQITGVLPSGSFIRRKIMRGRGGSVLIDCSGSMNVTLDTIQACVTAAPHGKVILYAGGPDDLDSGGIAVGVLAIVGRNGKMSTDLTPFQKHPHNQGGNTIDLPALDLLLKSQGPRTLVSDLQFCGAGQFDAIALLKAQSAQASGQITIIPSVAEATEAWVSQARQDKLASR